LWRLIASLQVRTPVKGSDELPPAYRGKSFRDSVVQGAEMPTKNWAEKEYASVFLKKLILPA